MRNVVYVLSKSPYDGDRHYQVARMALSLALDCEVHLILRGDAVWLARRAAVMQPKTRDYSDQERFLVEMEIGLYALAEDLECRTLGAPDARQPHINVIDAAQYARLLDNADIVMHV